MDHPLYKRHLTKAKEWTLQRLKRVTAADFQRMVRAEAGAFVGYVKAVVDGEIQTVFSGPGEVVCVTCGRKGPWKGSKADGVDGMDAGHFIPGRRNSILFEEIGVHPQCSWCNRNGGNPTAYHTYMQHVYGLHVIEALKEQERKSVSFSREELVRMRLHYRDRIKAATERMQNGDDHSGF